MGLSDLAPVVKGCQAANTPLKDFPEAKGEQTAVVVSESGLSFITGLGSPENKEFIPFYMNLWGRLGLGSTPLVRLACCSGLDFPSWPCQASTCSAGQLTAPGCHTGLGGLLPASSQGQACTRRPERG